MIWDILIASMLIGPFILGIVLRAKKNNQRQPRIDKQAKKLSSINKSQKVEKTILKLNSTNSPKNTKLIFSKRFINFTLWACIITWFVMPDFF